MIFLTAFITDSMSRLADSFYLDDIMMRDIVRFFFHFYAGKIGSVRHQSNEQLFVCLNESLFN